MKVAALRLEILGSSLRIAKKDDIVKLVGEIESQEQYTPNTKRDYRIMLRRYYSWLREEEKPAETSWIRTSVKKNHRILPENLLTEEDVERLIEAAQNPRDKAFVSTLYERAAAG